MAMRGTAKTRGDVIVIGGGAQGMLTARACAIAGRKVVLVERDRVAGGASRAGGGIMSPLAPWDVPPAVDALAGVSLPMLPELATALERDTGIDPEYRPSGAIYLEPAQLEMALAFAARRDMRAEVLEADALARLVPAARRGVERALLLPDIAQIRNPRFLDALARDLRLRGVAILEGAGEVSLEHGNDGVNVSAGPHGMLRAPDTVVAAGAWSGRLLAPLEVRLPLRPVRGQILWYRVQRGMLRHILMRGEHYVIPRHDEVVLVGSTVEDVGFDLGTTAAASETLRSAAAAMVPLLGSLPVQGQWSGLRPGSPDGIPWIGPVEGMPGLWVNTGHFRNGVNLGPGSAALLAALLTGAAPPLDPAPYRPPGRDGADLPSPL
ncbi:FAD-dependent oxidoreductase [Wenzhouxiangella sp. XN24]|uniref:NAD(P)/FAD-dependent oxidoreductase n=1 Tax=Wenzhouxiangella sp. XN24 TaxID=2713569 RepID=UPI0013ED2E04|nr:FAD-dependent oxidoreductase [Wenzhouxiangella sp. XN24]NGX15639.1 FAD-dependent oxidoreductase [Wenzhouxiangella sp. XN24]